MRAECLQKYPKPYGTMPALPKPDDMHIETERKFLVRDDSYKASAIRCHRLTQGYICRGSGRTVRVRLWDDRAVLTVKGPGNAGGMSRYEWEKEISDSDAKDLFLLCQDGIIDKTRYIVPAYSPCSVPSDGETPDRPAACGERFFEVDEFHGENAGLVIAEIELGSETEPFDRPDWLGEEVTGDPRYYNSYISLHPFSSWR